METQARRLIRAKLKSIAALKVYCYDYYPDVYRQIPNGVGYNAILNLLVGYCKETGQLPGLVSSLADQ